MDTSDIRIKEHQSVRLQSETESRDREQRLQQLSECQSVRLQSETVEAREQRLQDSSVG